MVKIDREKQTVDFYDKKTKEWITTSYSPKGKVLEIGSDAGNDNVVKTLYSEYHLI